MTVQTIPTLRQWGVHEVPDYDPDDDSWRERWFAARKAFSPVRLAIREACENDPEAQALELALCSQDIARWIAVWTYIEEPRILADESPIKPFYPMGFQVELCQWWAEKTGSPGRYDGLISKARGLGATWILCACATWAWLFREWRGTLVSRKEDLVDKPRDLNSMFGKIDFMLEGLPEWMLPSGFDIRYDRMKNMLKNPVTGAQITGEATSAKSTRGARATYIIYDEAAFIPDFKTVFGTGSGTTNHRWAVSSESFEEGDDWWRMWKGVDEAEEKRHVDTAQRSVKQLGWELNPYNDRTWYEEERQRWEEKGDLHGFEREYNRDPWAGSGHWVYPSANERVVTWTDDVYDPHEALLVGIDPGRADDTAIVFMQLVGDKEPRTARWLDSFSNHLVPAEYYAHILTGIYPQPGDACYGMFDHPNAHRDNLMQWLYDLPWRGAMRVFCDPAGSQKHADGLSFVERIVITSKKLRQREIAQGRGGKGDAAAVVPLYEELFAQNRIEIRTSAMRKLLNFSEFSRTAGAKRLQQALQFTRYSEPSDKSTAQPSPIHDEYSHLANAAAYIAVYLSLGLGRIKPATERRPDKKLKRAA